MEAAWSVQLTFSEYWGLLPAHSRQMEQILTHHKVHFVSRPLPAFGVLGMTKVGRNLETKLVTQLHKYSVKLTDVIPVFLNTAGFPYTVGGEWRTGD